MIGYYRKFLSRFADAVRPMTKLTRKDSKCEWSDDCQTGFEYLKTCLTEASIFKYPNPHKRYIVFTDTSDQAAAAVLIQEYSDENGEVKEMPITYLSAQFSDTQFKCSTIVKEGYGIYYAMKKWRHYLDDADILLKSDAKSLENFLHGKTDNHKLVRWSLELQCRNIEVDHIPGHKNKTADCLSILPFVTRKRNSNPLKDEVSLCIINENDKPFDSCCFLCKIGLTNTKKLQQSDKHCIRIAKLIADPKNRFNERDSYGYDDSGLLCHLNREKGKEFKATVVPKSLIKTVLQEMHDHFGHLGIGKTYSLAKKYYYWPKIIKHIQAPVDSCSLCRREKLQAEKCQLQTTEIPKKPLLRSQLTLKWSFPVSHSGNKIILVMTDHFTGWPIAAAIPDKEATRVENAIYRDLVLVHGCPEILLSDNGKVFTNDLLAYVCEEFSIEQHFTSPHTPRSNGKTENFNKFLKASIRKLYQEHKEAWDQVLPQILFAYRCCPHTSTGEPPYTLVHGRDPVLPINELIKVITPYWGESSLGKSIEQSRVSLSIAAKMLEKMRKNQKRAYEGRKTIHQFKVGDIVLPKNKPKRSWMSNGNPTIELLDWQQAGTRKCNVGDLQKKHPHEDWQLKASNVGTAAKFVNHPSNLPEVEYTVDKPDNCGNGKSLKGGHNLRKSIKPKQRLDL